MSSNEKTPLLHKETKFGESNGEISIENNDEESKKTERRSLLKAPLRKKLTLLVMMFTDFSSGVMFSMISPFFPILASQKGITATGIGIVFAAFQFLILSALIWGKLMGKIGAKFMYTTGIMVTSCCCVLFGVLNYCPAGNIFLVMCVLCRSLEGLAVGAYITASYSIATATFPDHLSTTVGLLEAVGSIGYMVGPMIGGVMYQAFGYTLCFLVAGLTLLMAGIISLFVIPSDSVKSSDSNVSMLKFIMNPQVLIFIIFVATPGLQWTFYDACLSLHLQKPQFHLSPLLIGIVFLVGPTLYAITTPIWGCISDKFSSKFIYLMLAATSLGGFCMFFVGPAPFFFLPKYLLWLLILGMVVQGMFISCIIGVFGEMSRIATRMGMPDDTATQGILSGVWSSSFSLGSLIGPLLGGALYDKVGFAWAATIIGIIPMAVVPMQLLYFLCIWLIRRKSTRIADTPIT